MLKGNPRVVKPSMAAFFVLFMAVGDRVSVGAMPEPRRETHGND
jgi:hypothetical protein